MKKQFQFTIGYHSEDGFVVVFSRNRYCTEEVADKYLDKLLDRFPGTVGGWEVLPW